MSFEAWNIARAVFCAFFFFNDNQKLREEVGI